MKTILIATDFSQAAWSASVYGIALAKAFSARVILLSTYEQTPIPLVETPDIISFGDMQEFTRDRLEQEAKLLNSGNSVTIETVFRIGRAADAILATANEGKADFIIVGMKKNATGFRKLFGSTVTTLIRTAKIPLIAVPSGIEFHKPVNIAIATESDLSPDTDQHFIDSFKEMALRFQCKVYIVRVAKNRFAEAYEMLNQPFVLNKIISELHPQYECIEGKTVREGLHEFLKLYRIDMLALLPHHHSLFETWFGNSTTKAMVFESQIPLLILPGTH